MFLKVLYKVMEMGTPKQILVVLLCEICEDQKLIREHSECYEKVGGGVSVFSLCSSYKCPGNEI